MKNWYLNAGYVNKNGYITASESWRVAHLIPVSGDSILVTGQFGYMSGSDEYNNVVCYDMDRKFLGGCFRAENNKVYDNYVITLLPNTRFISITTSEKLLPKLSVYLYDNMLPLNLLSNYATSWQWMNGSVDIRFTGSKVTVTFPEGKNVYVCRRPNGTQYEQTLLTDASSISVDFSTKSGGLSTMMARKYLRTSLERRLKFRSSGWQIPMGTGASCSPGTVLCLLCFMMVMSYMLLHPTTVRSSTASTTVIRRRLLIMR